MGEFSSLINILMKMNSSLQGKEASRQGIFFLGIRGKLDRYPKLMVRKLWSVGQIQCDIFFGK